MPEQITTAAGQDAVPLESDAQGRALRVTVTVDTDELRAWAEKHADAGHHGVAHVLYQAAAGAESLTEQALAEAGARAVAEAEARGAQEVPSQGEWITAVGAERRRQREQGYTDEHDREQGADHLLDLAIEYGRQGEAVKAAALAQAARQVVAHAMAVQATRPVFAQAVAEGAARATAEARAETERLSAVHDDALAMLDFVADHMDEFAYDELRSALEDGVVLNDDGTVPGPVRKALAEAEARGARDEAIGARDAWPTMLRDMVSRGHVRSWLAQRAEQAHERLLRVEQAGGDR